ncbi:multidrug effflux MFS transporter [Coraliomargarita sp. SDUM461003]|uniref:Multidrug effflux MFS transporter n=1 Tax=Thalassobacterium maritimum TaxID=3041265 RepID=A0ABU1AUP6_9BACT|nr:multidrug effflux MFS transporter [Coraliomargarita sp. SDUM461003]MDQ8207362.1 multidrug effflux MFS transporter [Coraliomargarita sp. SDUM461003]
MPLSEKSQAIHAPLGLQAICVLSLLSAVAPIATDMYLPGFPQISETLGAGASATQLTLTSFLIGLALGQLVIGPLSDNYGRCKPLLYGTALTILSGLLCVIVPNIESLIVLRGLQGFGGAAGVVLARAIIADRAPDSATVARQTQIMTMIGGVAPILAPITGTLIVTTAGWRAVFLVTALLSVIAFIGVLRYITESLPVAQRVHASRQALRHNILRLVTHRAYLGYTLVTSFAFMALFGYIAASPFVFQNVLGLSATQYSIAFGVNALGIILFGAISARLVMRVAPRTLVSISLAVQLIAAAAVLIFTSIGAGAIFIMPAIFFTVASVGPIIGNASALAIRQVPEAAGTASAVLGATQFGLGAIASPLVGLMGENNPLPMACLIACASLSAVICFITLTQQKSKAEVSDISIAEAS